MPANSIANWDMVENASKPPVVLLGPPLEAVGGIAEHLRQLLASTRLAEEFCLDYFAVGSPGEETPAQKLWRLLVGPLVFFFRLRRYRGALVHINTALNPKAYWRDLAFLVAAKLQRCKIVFQIHGGGLPEEFFDGRRWAKLLRQTVHWPDAIVLLSQAETAVYHRFAPGQRLEIIPNAINAAPFLARPLDREPLGPLYLVYLGRVVENKGVFTVVEAFQRLVAQGRTMRLTFAGSGPDEARLQEKVRALGLEDQVQFAGPVFGQEKIKLWLSADVFVFPTWHKEGLPYALLEAMAAGAVPITTPVGAIPEVMEDGVHGLFVPAQDPEALACAIAGLDEDRARWLRLAQAARARVLEQYTIERLAADLARVYTSL